jgi:alkanesulfonate monooxygenase SsuD/methylene tetrahydromethanopterin reductase-like flavin-dependent oxidoreductase (luciferase family)
MKFSLFAHMERIDPEQDQKQLYEEFIQLCKIADDGGMHAIWTGEHHGMNFTIAPNPFLNLVDLARRTKNVRLGTGTVVAPFWHPIRLAGEAAMADLITDGRLDIGIARGAYNFEYERLVPGMDAWEAGQRMRELVPAVKQLWKGDYAQNGEFHSFPKTTSAPQPIQENGPPHLGGCA